MTGEQALFFILSVWVTLMALGLAFDAAGAFMRARAAFIRANRHHQTPPVGINPLTAEQLAVEDDDYRAPARFPLPAKEWER